MSGRPFHVNAMNNIVVVGVQWGDEGKGKIVDLMAPAFDIVARYQGGHNAGHTVWIGDQKFVLHLVPSGILHDHCACVIGNGVVVDAEALVVELEKLRASGVAVAGRLFVSNRAHLILPYHRLVEGASETRLGDERVGTTMRGIGPTYEDKAGRRGLRAGDLLFPDEFKAKLRANVAHVNELLVAQENEPLDIVATIDGYMEAATKLVPYIADTARYVNEAISAGKRVLLEGAQATMLDVDHGTYPYVTSSSSTAGGACIGIGLAPSRISGVLGIAKAYATRVGAGPFPTELHDETGEFLRAKGHEFGASTGRPRRTGWFDVPVARYAAMINGIDSLAITKLDVLDEVDEIQICTGYRHGDEVISHVPESVRQYAAATPIYEKFSGWRTSTRGIRQYEDLPERARMYIERLADLVGVEIGLVSTGPEREEIILRPESLLNQWLSTRTSKP